ncbi:hypothetical protein [Blastopirellula marina]|uniref:hypothetical protein n=1 Tax=Blastopirellula marina TaxID=124 RepID=UPI000309DB0C|nr:hypothetical protein [Blastopirellula marina]
MSDITKIYVGVDVSKSEWDVAITGTRQTFTFEANVVGQQQLLRDFYDRSNRRAGRLVVRSP